MNYADKIIVAETHKIVERFFEIKDLVEYGAFVRDLYSDFDVGQNDLQMLTGVSSTHIHHRRSASGAILAQRNGSENYPDRFTEMVPVYEGRALTREEHGVEGWRPWTDAEWLDECPERFKTWALRQAVEQAVDMHWIVPLYLEHDGRFPDAAGFAFWLGLLADGHSEDIVRGWIVDGFAEARG